MNLPFLGENPLEFPSTRFALDDPNGLLAAGGDLSAARLLAAYTMGIFPWYQDDQPILWWSPDPRLVVKPKDCHTSKSMAKLLRKTTWKVVIDRNFPEVIRACSSSRQSQQGTWITEDMLNAYIDLHHKQFAHSIEVWDDGQIIGGLYGLALGKVFFGESMFSRTANASKVAFILLSRFLEKNDFQLIDCQVSSDHLLTLGASEISRDQFEQRLSLLITEESVHYGQQVWRKAQNQVISIDGHIKD